MKRRRYTFASIIAVAGFAALFAVLPPHGTGKEVKMVGRRYVPATIQIKAGGAVTFINESKFTHTATCQGCTKDTGDVQPGVLRTLTFTRTGTFQLFCRYHGNQGMVAVITVR